MPDQNTVLYQLLKHVPKRARFEELAKAHGSDDAARGLDSQSQLVALLYGQLSGGRAFGRSSRNWRATRRGCPSWVAIRRGARRWATPTAIAPPRCSAICWGGGLTRGDA